VYPSSKRSFIVEEKASFLARTIEEMGQNT